MCVCDYLTISAKKYQPKTFFHGNLQQTSEDLFKKFYVSLGKTISFISLLKSQRFASSVPFNVIEMF